MAKEIKIHEIITRLGYTPLENQAIVVTYAPENLSGRLRSFFRNQFYVLQLCTDRLVMLPLNSLTTLPAKEAALEIPAVEIRSVSITEEYLNYQIKIETKEDTITLSAQQKELAEMRHAGAMSVENWLGTENWHRRNLDTVLAALKQYGGSDTVTG